MSGAAATAVGPAELRSLYGRYKSLALAGAAALVLDEPAGGLVAEAEALYADCGAAAGAAPPELRPQLDACVAAARELDALLRRGARGEPVAAAIEATRATHRSLRREVWKVLPCEYVPCGAELHAHHHGGENDA